MTVMDYNFESWRNPELFTYFRILISSQNIKNVLIFKSNTRNEYRMQVSMVLQPEKAIIQIYHLY